MYYMKICIMYNTWAALVLCLSNVLCTIVSVLCNLLYPSCFAQLLRATLVLVAGVGTGGRPEHALLVRGRLVRIRGAIDTDDRDSVDDRLMRALLVGRVAPQRRTAARFVLADGLLLPLRLRHGLLHRSLLRLVRERALLAGLLLARHSRVLARERGAHA